MTDRWSSIDLDTIGAANEIEVAPSSPDRSRRAFTTIWVVRIGDELYVRSYHGPSGSWYRRAIGSRRGRLRVGGAEWMVNFAEASEADPGTIDDAYRAKYGRSGYVDTMVAAAVVATTLRITPV